MISQRAEYALRVIVYLGTQHGQPCAVPEVSRATGAPSSYLTKVMTGLIRAGIVGVQNGFVLSREAKDLTILDVVTAVDAFHRDAKCPLGAPAHASGLCPLHRRMDNVTDAAGKARGETIGQVLEEPNLVCGLPCISGPTADPQEQLPLA